MAQRQLNDNGDWSTGSDALNEDEIDDETFDSLFFFEQNDIIQSQTHPATNAAMRCHLLLYEVVMMLLVVVLLIVLSLKATRLLLLQFLPSQRISSQSKKHGHVKPTSTDFN